MHKEREVHEEHEEREISPIPKDLIENKFDTLLELLTSLVIKIKQGGPRPTSRENQAHVVGCKAIEESPRTPPFKRSCSAREQDPRGGEMFLHRYGSTKGPEHVLHRGDEHALHRFESAKTLGGFKDVLHRGGEHAHRYGSARDQGMFDHALHGERLHVLHGARLHVLHGGREHALNRS